MKIRREKIRRIEEEGSKEKKEGRCSRNKKGALIFDEHFNNFFKVLFCIFYIRLFTILSEVNFPILIKSSPISLSYVLCPMSYVLFHISLSFVLFHYI